MNLNNLVSIKINAQDKARAEELLTELETILTPYLVSLTEDERKQRPKMGEGTQPFVQKAMEYGKSNPEYAPPYASIEELETDLKTVTDLRPIYKRMDKLRRMLDDTMLLAGSEAYIAALSFYRSVQNAAERGAMFAVAIADDLKARFVRQGSGKKRKNKKSD